jgi:cell division septation protein DedD
MYISQPEKRAYHARDFLSGKDVKGGIKMVLDYSEHKSVSKNRPRKQPAAVFLFSLLVAVGISFTLGVATGWLIFHPARKNGVVQPDAAVAVNQRQSETSKPNRVQLPAEPSGKAVEPSLTFYETLPKGNRELMGSGLNLPKSAEQTQGKGVPKPKLPPLANQAASEKPAAQSKETAKIPAKAPEPSPTKDESQKEGDGKGKFVVQVAAYHIKKEAEEACDRLKAYGMAAYIVEYNVPEKGVNYYRVRVGRHLDKQAAREIADKAGKGSIIIPE